MELAASMPSSIKLRGMNGKYIFKKALRQTLPDSVLARRKMGFAVPLAQWFRNELKDLAHSVILGRSVSTPLNLATAKRVWEEHQSGLRNRSTELWALLMFRLWERQFLARD
jgi:asparagine synthase (glutamine-hydrolysing)